MKFLFSLFILVFFSKLAIAEYCWIQRADAGILDRYAAYGFSINGKGYVIGGFYNGTALTDNWEYDHLLNSWTQKADIPGVGRWAGAAFVINGKGYLTVGHNGIGYPVTTYEYNPANNTWLQKTDFPFCIQDCHSFAIGNFGYVLGGFYANNYSDNLHRYDPVTDTWTQMSTFPGGIHDGTRGFTINNIEHVVGGLSMGNATNWHYTYDPATNSWNTKAPMPGTARHSCSTFEMNGHGFAGNGGSIGNNSNFLNDFYEYDPVTDTWTAIPDFPGQILGYTAGFTIGVNGYIATGKLNSSTNSNETWMLGYKPEALFTADYDSCGLTVSFTNLSNNGTTYNWNFGDGTSINNSSLTNPVHTYPATGTYTVVLVAGNGFCSDTAIQQINVYGNLTATVYMDTDECSRTVTINGFSTNASTVFWQWGDGQQTSGAPLPHTYPSSGNYTISLLLNNGTCSHTLTYPVNIPVQAVSAFSVSTACDLGVTIINNSTNSNTYSWNWGNGETTAGIQTGYTYELPGTYTISLAVSDSICFDTSSVIITVSEDTNYQITAQADSCSGIMRFSINPPPDNVQWEMGDGTTASGSPVSHNYTNAADYTVIALINPNGACPDTATITVTPVSAGFGAIFIPNVFTPNNDHFNDFFSISNSSTCNFEEIQIYNRWGMLIYTSADPDFKWDGKHNGVKCPEGVFVYIIKTGKENTSGTISVIR